tara:strand:+ start:708 stop:887 length:180 start_codon:yes stop_codon:yes gene_type:complete
MSPYAIKDPRADIIKYGKIIFNSIESSFKYFEILFLRLKALIEIATDSADEIKNGMIEE